MTEKKARLSARDLRLLGSVVYTAAILVLVLPLTHDRALWPLATGGLFLALAGALWFGWEWWNRLDEAAQEAHKWAWYWGGSVGLALAGAAMPVLFQSDALVTGAARLEFEKPAELIAFGGMLVMLLQLGGYTVAWALWWLRRR